MNGIEELPNNQSMQFNSYNKVNNSTYTGQINPPDDQIYSVPD